MNSTMLAVIVGALVIGLGALGFSAWNGSQSASNRMAFSMPAAMGNVDSMGSGMMGSGMMGGGMMGSMGSMMQGQGMGGMQNGMMGGWGCCGAPGQQAYTPTNPQPSAAVAANAVDLRGFAFNPPVIKVRKGATVTWTNRDNVPHTVTASDGSFRSGLLNLGQSWSFTFDKPGTYSYYCEPHPYMQGQVIVEDTAK